MPKEFNYLFAVAFGAGNTNVTSGLSNNTLSSASVSGSNTLGIVGILLQTDFTNVSATWNSVSMPTINSTTNSINTEVTL